MHSVADGLGITAPREVPNASGPDTANGCLPTFGPRICTFGPAVTRSAAAGCARSKTGAYCYKHGGTVPLL